MQMVDRGDAELATWRDGEGDPVLLISGLGGRAAFWSELVTALAPHFDVISHDHRGTGASTKSKIEYSVSQMAGDVLKLMDALNIPKAALVGHSTGGRDCPVPRTQSFRPRHQNRFERDMGWAKFLFSGFV